MSTIPKKLTHDKNFIPCPVVDSDEFYPNGIFVFNITKIEDHIRENPDFALREEVALKGLTQIFTTLSNRIKIIPQTS